MVDDDHAVVYALTNSHVCLAQVPSLYSRATVVLF